MTGGLKIVWDDVAASALAKLGSGNNMPGYYMYHGGVNPEGKLSNLQEDHPKRLPVKDYDFQIALGSSARCAKNTICCVSSTCCFRISAGGWHACRLLPRAKAGQLERLGHLALECPLGRKSGFLFFNNRQPYEPLPDHKGVQFTIKTTAGSLPIPAIPSRSHPAVTESGPSASSATASR